MSGTFPQDLLIFKGDENFQFFFFFRLFYADS